MLRTLQTYFLTFITLSFNLKKYIFQHEVLPKFVEHCEKARGTE